VDALNVSLLNVTTTDGIDAAAVTTSFSKCGGPATWKLNADGDSIGPTIGSMGDMNDATMSSSDVLDFLCSRYDAGNKTDTCAER
jgi:hypothetical protein